jgi:transposase InsO family protein
MGVLPAEVGATVVVAVVVRSTGLPIDDAGRAHSLIMTSRDDTPARVRWARLRFQIIGTLLAAPAEDGELKRRIEELASRPWRHPTTEEVIRFSFKTIERWFYTARGAPNPIDVLARKVPRHAGTHPMVSEGLGDVIARQYREHPRWTFQLHHDNLLAIVRERPELGPMPGYTTVCRYMKHHGLLRVRKKRQRDSEVAFERRETRSFEVSHVHGLWHLDFHEGSRAILTPDGEWNKPQVVGILDDRSRLCCHLQWYWAETAEVLVHALSQAFHKRGLPRALLTDNGAAMLAAETIEGLERLGIVHHTTLPYSPEQNGKQESFWGQIEGRLLPMLESEPELGLELLNTASQAWVEHEYHRKEHSEIKETPLERYLRGPSVGRESPSSDALRRAFKTEISRNQRRTDGTVTVEGVRFEVPAAYRTLVQLRLRTARWDLSSVDLVDPRSGAHLATLLPLDKAKNAERVRRIVGPAEPEAVAPKTGIAPHLRALMAEYAATGLPPGFVPKHDRAVHHKHDEPIDDNEEPR